MHKLITRLQLLIEKFDVVSHGNRGGGAQCSPRGHVVIDILGNYVHAVLVFLAAQHNVKRQNGQVQLFNKLCDLSAELAEKLVILLADLHRMGVEHGDVSLRNLYCTVSGSWGVIDLDNCRIFSGSLPPERRIRELARLASSFLKLTQGVVPDGMEPDIPGFFARIYCRCSGFDPECSAYRKRVAYLAERKRKQYV